MSVLYRLKNVVKTYTTHGVGFRLRVPSIEIKAREAVALVGYSGSGKSTLLDILAMVLRPDEAECYEFSSGDHGSTDVAAIWASGNQDRLSELRKRSIGYVLQTGGLLPYLTVRENINLPRRLLGLPEDHTVVSLAQALGIAPHLDKLPGLLSAGERQRAAFARALAHHPTVVLADEPTASLDPITARKVIAKVMDLVRDLGITLITASHDWARIYQLDFRSLHQESVEGEDGNMVESTFSD